jgi:hypothetical protein
VAIGPMLPTTGTIAPLDAGLAARLAHPSSASDAADTRSVNRFADFEDGVLFWFRGATGAATLSPIDATADGTSLSFSGASVAASALASIGRSTFETTNAQLASMTFAGVTGYSFDGVQVHNRRHRLQLILQGTETRPVTGSFVPVTASIELQVELWFDPSLRRIALTPTDWILTQASSSAYGAVVGAALRANLDPLLWTSYEFITLPDTDAGAPIAVLSVKTLPNGVVGVFLEPTNRVLTSISGLTNAVAPSVVVFAQSLDRS